MREDNFEDLDDPNFDQKIGKDIYGPDRLRRQRETSKGKARLVNELKRIQK